MILLDLDPGAPAFHALLIFCLLPVLFNLPPFLAHRKSNIILSLYFVPIFLYVVVICFFTVTNNYFFWSFRGDFLMISTGITLLNLLILTLRRKDMPEDY